MLLLQKNEVERPRNSNRFLGRNSISRTPVAEKTVPARSQLEQSRPAPASLQQIVDRPSVARPQQLELEFQTEPEQSFRFQTEQPIRVQPPARFQPDQPIREENPEAPILPARLTPIRIQPATTEEPETVRPSRFQVSVTRPSFRSPFRTTGSRTTTTEAPSTTAARARPFSR